VHTKDCLGGILDEMALRVAVILELMLVIAQKNRSEIFEKF